MYVSVLIDPEHLSVNLEGIFKTVEFEHFYLTQVQAEFDDLTTLVLYTVIMYNFNRKNSLFLLQYVGLLKELKTEGYERNGIYHSCSVCTGQKNLSLCITVRHHSASLVIPNSDPWDRFFYPHQTAMEVPCNMGPCP